MKKSLAFIVFMILVSCGTQKQTIQEEKYLHKITTPESWTAFDWHGGRNYTPTAIYEDESLRYNNNITIIEWDSGKSLAEAHNMHVSGIRKAFIIQNFKSRAEQNQFGETYITEYSFGWAGKLYNVMSFMFKQGDRLYQVEIRFNTDLYNAYISQCLELLGSLKLPGNVNGSI